MTSSSPRSPSFRQLRDIAIALAPPLVAFAIETRLLAPTGSRWLLMIAGVIVSAANGGIAAGLLSTVLSAALVWWYLIPPRETLGSADPAHYLSAAIFIAVGVAVSLLHDRLRRTTERLAKSQRVLQGVLDNSPNGIVIKRLDGRYVTVNDGFAAMTHLSRENVVGKTDAELFATPLAERLRANDAQAVSTRQSVVSEETLEIDGRRRVFLVTKFPLLDETNTIVALCAIWTEITQRKLDEDALRRVASDLRTAQRVAHVGSWRSNLGTGETEWSEELYRIFGQDPMQPRRVPLIDPDSHILTDDSRARLRAAVDKTIADGSGYEIDLEFTRPDGDVRWISARGEPVRDETGRIVAINGTAADITRLKDLQRLRDEWTSVIAHDLRQPIGTILMASGILPDLADGEMSKDAREMVQRVHTASLTLKRMVDDLLDMSLLEANRLKLERKWQDPTPLVRQTVGQLAHLPGIERVHVVSDAGTQKIFVDAMRLEQALANLISNAIKYGDPRTDVIVRVAQREHEVEITVTNRGPGIPPEELPRLFDRFMRSKTARGSGVRGLGLGLYIAKGIVEAHGGRIWAQSTPGAETTFHVSLPASAEARASA